MFFDTFLDAFLDQFWGGFDLRFRCNFLGLKGPVLEVILEVPKVDSEHPYTTLKGFYMSKKSIKNEVPRRKKTRFRHPKMVAFLTSFLEHFWRCF